MPYKDTSVTGAEKQEGDINAKLHRARAQEFVISQMLGISVALGSVWAGRHVAPKQMEAAAKMVEKLMTPHMAPQDAAYRSEEARRITNYAIMFAGGLATNLTTQVALARQRRNGKDQAEDIPLSRDLSRVFTGWTVGALGASASVALADRYLRAGSAHALSDVVTQAEKLLDAHLFKGAELAKHNKVSEAVVSNLTMVVGAMPVSVAAQRLYDAIFYHPAYDRAASASRLEVANNSSGIGGWGLL